MKKQFRIFPILTAVLLTNLPVILFSQGVYNDGAKIVIGAGSYFYVSGTGGNFRNETNGTDGAIALSGTLKLDGNLINNVAAADVFFNPAPGSTVALTGTTVQTLGGTTTAPFVFSNLSIDNLAGITLSNNVMVNGVLTLGSGLVNLGSKNLTMGTAATVAGTPSATAMVVATGTGSLQKSFAGTGSFNFPVGDNTGTAEYSPVSLNFTSGTFNTGALAGVNLVNGKYNSPVVTGSYLNRYWNVFQTGITSFSCDATFDYAVADVTGTERYIQCIRVAPSPVIPYSPADTVLHRLTANGITTFGTYTGSNINIALSGPRVVCQNSTGNVYTTDAGMNNYVWAISAGGSITAGGTATDNTVTVTWNTSGAQTVSVSYNGIPLPTVLNVTVDPIPVPSIGGPAVICGYTAGNIYTTEAGMSGYSWSVTGGTITTGTGTGSITVTWTTPGAHSVSVSYTDANGCPAAIPTSYPVNVYPPFVVGSISNGQTVCPNGTPALLSSTPPTGGATPYSYQWQSSLDNLTFADIPGATQITYQPGPATLTTYYRLTQTSAAGCGSGYTNSDTVTVQVPPPDYVTVSNMTIGTGQKFCADANITLKVSDSVTMFHAMAGSTVNLLAGTNVRILPDTKLDSGSYAHIFVSTNCLWCSPYKIIAAQQDSASGETTTDLLTDKSAGNHFRIYPNPTTGSFTVELAEVPETTPVNVEIFGMTGAKVLHDQYTGEKRHVFTLEGNPTGIYFIRVSCGKDLGAQKIIRQ